MEKNHLEAFSAIKSFVTDLWGIYGSKTVTPLALYHRLLQKIKSEEKDRIKMTVDGFIEFLKENEKYLITQEYNNIPMGTKITFGLSPNISIDIQHYIHRSNSDTKEAIRQHLLTIAIILSPSEEKITTLEKSQTDTVNVNSNVNNAPTANEQENAMKELGIDTTTQEGKFIGNIMDRTRIAMENVTTDNPMQAMMAMFQSGVLTDMIGGMQQGVDSGNMDMGKLFGVMQHAMGSLAPPGKVNTATPQPLKVEEVSPQTISKDNK